MQTLTTPQAPTATKPTGEPTELGHYLTGAGQRRIIVGRRIEGSVRVFDVAAGSRLRGYEVDEGFIDVRELAAMVADYKRQAAKLGHCPMSRKGIREMLAGAVR